MRILNPYRYGGLDAVITSKNFDVWYEARKETAYADGGSVTTMTDWSGNARDADGTGHAPTYKTGIVNGLPVFRWTGTEYTIDTGWTFNQPNSIIAVCKYDNADTAQHQVVASSNGAANNTVYTAGGNWNIYAGSALTDGADDANWHVLSANFNGGSSQLFKDGTSVASGNANTQNMTGIVVGSNPVNTVFWDGDIAMILVRDTILSTADREAVEDAIGVAYGITITH